MTLENLLNTLIQRGWKPSWKECSHFIRQYSSDVLDWKLIYTAVRIEECVYDIHYTLRELVSKESWLWQFVCDNKLQNTTDWEYERRLKKASDCWWDGSEYNTKNDGWYEYRIIESALQDEDELEQFLLENIYY